MRTEKEIREKIKHLEHHTEFCHIGDSCKICAECHDEMRILEWVLEEE